MPANGSDHGTAGRWRWPRSLGQVRAHAILTAVVLWVGFIITHAAGQGDRSIAGPLKGADFAHFYTIGALARSHQPEVLYDFGALHRAQVSRVPASAPELFVPVYPPQTALFFAPFSAFSYRQATLLWNLVTLAVFVLVVRRAWRPVAGLLPDSRFVIAAAAAFPPFWSLMLHGQTTAMVLTAFAAGWLALERQRSFLAGMAFGLLLVKPQFAIPLVVLVLAFREWKMLAGALTSVVLQVVSTAILLGTSVLTTYVKFIPVILRNSDLLEPKHYQNHSLRALTRLTPAWMDLPLWLMLSGVVLATMVSVWKTSAPLRVRFGLVILASVLVSPHLLVYDATVLALPLLWFAAYVAERNRPSEQVPFYVCVYWLFVTLLAPSAAVVGVQVSVLLLVWLFARIARAASTDSIAVPRETYGLDPAPGLATACRLQEPA